MAIEWFMFAALGFFLGCLLGLMLVPPLWNRAVKLTTRRLEATMPMTLPDIQAAKDQQRAEFAIQLRKVEVALEKSKEKAARELIEANKRRVEIQLLKEELKGVQSSLQENENANRVLQQTIKRRLPDLDTRLKAAKRALLELETVNAELRNTVGSQSEALKIARSTAHNQRADIDRLRMSLESASASGRGSGKSSGRAVAEAQRLAAELSRTQEELEHTKVSTDDIAFLRRELNDLASHIMSTARTQAVQQPATAPATDAHADDARADDVSAGDARAGDVSAVEIETRGEFFGSRHAHEGNGAAPHAGEHEPVMEQIEMAVEAAEIAAPEIAAPEMVSAAEAARAEDARAKDASTEDADAVEPAGEVHAEEEARTSLSQRFAARRAKRAKKSGGGSLTSRLRSLVADGR